VSIVYHNLLAVSNVNPDQALVFRVLLAHHWGYKVEPVITAFTKAEANRLLKILQASETGVSDLLAAADLDPPAESIWDEVKPLLIRRIKTNVRRRQPAWI
jgi:hypothetical protein